MLLQATFDFFFLIEVSIFLSLWFHSCSLSLISSIELMNLMSIKIKFELS